MREYLPDESGVEHPDISGPRLGQQPDLHKLLSISENSSVGRAQPCQGWGREFESRFSLLQSLLD